MNIEHYRHWNPRDHDALKDAKSFVDLAAIALDILRRTPGKAEMVSGPISTGGVGTIQGNRKVFEGVIEILIGESHRNIFSQMPFEDKMVELYLEWHRQNPAEEYCTPILNDFYEKVFLSGKVSALHFIHGWESSFGARWEHGNCDRWGIEKRYLPQELSVRALDFSVTTK